MGQTAVVKSVAGFSLNNRKYLGAKYRLLNFITETVLSRVPVIDTFIDGFAGTGVVGNHFRRYARCIVSNDLLFSNYVINRAFLSSTSETVDLAKVQALLQELNGLEPKYGYVYENYGGLYFTAENAARIDAIRERIDTLHGERECSLQENYVLLTCLLYAADKAANTVGQYDAFLKHISAPAGASAGRRTLQRPAPPPRRERGQPPKKHLIDSRVYQPLELRLPAIELDGKEHEVYNEDLNRLIHRLRGEVLYLDPPYNGRQYIDCYHVLENIMRWEKPPLYGKTRKFRRNFLKSRYSRRSEALGAFSELIAAARCGHIFLSYNSEGIIPDSAIVEILSRKGSLEVFEREYAVFGNGAGSSRRRMVKERLFYCRALR